ncbi:cochlin isoform X2 [Stegostoma tigrinum]|uniref:cochlin isoform X2 n=1 Tax=Stegostoma tigrinum TaxID=3053191 RepID=UPI00287019F0|nr:cochlin isoform X2 [Stegostoma tigrinum]XP_048394538.2 cochlin isoform X2 [Stegostoma tigrinum]
MSAFCTAILSLGVLTFTSSAKGAQGSVPISIGCTTRGAYFKENRVDLLCPPRCDYSQLSVWGSGVYASVSSICAAAVHSGVIKTSGGIVRLQKSTGQENYQSSTANGIRSLPLSQWMSSFSVSKIGRKALEVSGPPKATVVPTAVRPTKKKAAKSGKKILKVNKECKADIAFLLDGSCNLGKRRFELQKNFVIRVTNSLGVGPQGPLVGIVQVSENPKTEFNLKNFTNSKDVASAIKNVTYRGGSTNVGKALIHTTENFFTPDKGTRPGYPKVIVVVVDGWPSDEIERAANLARESGVNVFIVSVAKALPEEQKMVPDPTYMDKIVCRNNGLFSYAIPNWFGTYKFIKPIAQRLCSYDQMTCSRTCYNSVNLGFLIDGSSSVGDANFRTVLSFITEIVKSFDIHQIGARVGAVQFTYNQRTEFDFGEHLTTDSVLNAIKAIPYWSGGTATGEAITYTTKNLFGKLKNSNLNVLIIITDGQSYDDVEVPATVAHQSGTVIFSVGISWAMEQELKAMASEPKDAHTFFVRDFPMVFKLVPDILKGICKDYLAVAM